MLLVFHSPSTINIGQRLCARSQDDLISKCDCFGGFDDSFQAVRYRVVLVRDKACLCNLTFESEYRLERDGLCPLSLILILFKAYSMMLSYLETE